MDRTVQSEIHHRNVHATGMLLRAVYVSHSPDDRAGAELALLELVQGIVESGAMDVHVVVPADGPLRRRLTAFGVQTSVIPELTWTDIRWIDRQRWFRFRCLGYVLRRARSVLRLARLLRELRCDVVVSNTSTVIAPALAAQIARVPHVWYVHEFGVSDHAIEYDVGYERSMNLVGKLSRQVVVPSLAVGSALRTWIAPNQLRVISCAVEGLDPLRVSEDDGTWRLVLLGRKSPGKGQMEALEAVAILRSRGMPVRLRLVGGGDASYIATLHERARRLGLEPYVESIDHSADVARHYEWAHVVLMCSSAEAFGRVTVEAMKAGRPVIGARAAGTAELIRDGENGFLYEPGDVEGLASKVALVVSDPHRMAEVARNAQDWAFRHFSLDRYVREFASVLYEAVGITRAESIA